MFLIVISNKRLNKKNNMVLKVLIVDDSTFFRKRLTEIIQNDKDLELVGEALNGKEAVTKCATLHPDVITMDVEMPVMNGIEAVREIMRTSPTPILMFSSLTKDGAKATMDALEAGALDFLPKNFDDIARKKQEAIDTIKGKIKELGRSKSKLMRVKPTFGSSTTQSNHAVRISTHTSTSTSLLNRRNSTLNSTLEKLNASTSRLNSNSSRPSSSLFSKTSSNSKSIFNSTESKFQSSSTVNKTSVGVADKSSLKVCEADFSKRTNKLNLLAIGSSTGGPLALQGLLSAIPGNFPVPIIVMQHMPAAFTGPFADRLNALCPLTVSEAKDGDVIRPGHIYVAPGGKQMLLEKNGISTVLKIIDGPPSLNYKPSVDVAFGSAAQIYQDSVLGVILTGMGADGCKGAQMLKNSGSSIWAQDENTCVIYGMPKAVVEAGIASKVLPIGEIAANIVKEFSR